MKKVDKSTKSFKLRLLALAAAALLQFLCCSLTTAHEATVQNIPPQLSQQTIVPIQLPNYNNLADPTGGDILIDNFEYWNDPKNHGWIVYEPTYPTYGYGIGYGQVMTTQDAREGSHVLDVYRNASVFLPFNEPPLSDPAGDKYRYMPFTIIRSCNYLDATGAIQTSVPGRFNLLSFKVRAPLSVEMFDTFRFVVDITTDQGGYARIVLLPRERIVGSNETSEDTVQPKNALCSKNPNNADVIEVYMGRDFQDGTWHQVIQDLNAILTRYVGFAGPENIANITQIMIRGNLYRLDDITFTQGNTLGMGCPYLYKIGPLFVQLFTSMEKLVFAEDHVGNIYDVLIDSDDIVKAYAEDSRDGFADPDIYWDTTVNPPTPRNANDIENWTSAEIDVIRQYVRNASLDPNGPVLSNQGMRRKNLGNNNHEEDILHFTTFVGGSGSTGSYAAGMMRPLEIRTGSGKPAFLPAYYHFGAESPLIVPHGHPVGTSHESDGLYYFTPQRVSYIEQALVNAGYTYWPNVAVLQFQPQTLEDLIVTVEVSNGLFKDRETFPVSVVNYPVDNYPPIMEDLDTQIAYVGEMFMYTVTAVDPDSTIYSSIGSHPKADQFNLTWTATIGDLPAYQYGPWSEAIMNPISGMISFVPQFEGVYPIKVKVQDDRGYYTINEFEVVCVNSGTWLNHPPVVVGDWDHPQVCRAGELLILDSEIDVTDPDGDKVYYSCSVGSIGTDSAGNVAWSFQTQYPGFYVVYITAMDGRGGFTQFTIDLDVQPWWSF
jgi:hypothetical protein